MYKHFYVLSEPDLVNMTWLIVKCEIEFKGCYRHFWE